MMKRTEVFSRPSVVDITIAVARVNAGDWFDPYEYDDEPLRYQPFTGLATSSISVGSMPATAVAAVPARRWRWRGSCCGHWMRSASAPSRSTRYRLNSARLAVRANPTTGL